MVKTSWGVVGGVLDLQCPKNIGQLNASSHLYEPEGSTQVRKWLGPWIPSPYSPVLRIFGNDDSSTVWLNDSLWCKAYPKQSQFGVFLRYSCDIARKMLWNTKITLPITSMRNFLSWFCLSLPLSLALPLPLSLSLHS